MNAQRILLRALAIGSFGIVAISTEGQGSTLASRTAQSTVTATSINETIPASALVASSTFSSSYVSACESDYLPGMMDLMDGMSELGRWIALMGDVSETEAIMLHNMMQDYMDLAMAYLACNYAV